MAFERGRKHRADHFCGVSDLLLNTHVPFARWTFEFRPALQSRVLTPTSADGGYGLGFVRSSSCFADPCILMPSLVLSTLQKTLNA